MPVWLKPRTSVQRNEPFPTVVVVEPTTVVVVTVVLGELARPQSGGVGLVAALHASAELEYCETQAS
jgi:hypothetical protein